jgi:hypothetical protein
VGLADEGETLGSRIFVLTVAEDVLVIADVEGTGTTALVVGTCAVVDKGVVEGVIISTATEVITVVSTLVVVA